MGGAGLFPELERARGRLVVFGPPATYSHTDAERVRGADVEIIPYTRCSAQYGIPVGRKHALAPHL